MCLLIDLFTTLTGSVKDVTNRAYVEEIFGPVLFCVKVATLDDAIAFTNASKVWT